LFNCRNETIKALRKIEEKTKEKLRLVENEIEKYKEAFKSRGLN